MRRWGRWLQAGLETSIVILERLGVRGARWEWRKRGWRQALEIRLASWEKLERGVRVRMRMCPSCRALVDRREPVCPECGASLRGVPGGGAARLLRLLVPGTGSVTILLVSANVAMSILIYLVWGAAEGPTGLLGLLAPPGKALYLFGAKWTPAILSGEVWRLVTAGYLHGGIVHLVFNCFTLMSLGPLIEESFGARKFFLIYSLTGVAAFAASALLRPTALSIGASGSLFGLLGFAVVYGRYRAGAGGRAISDQLLRYLLFALVLFLVPQIDNVAHVGGLAAGAALGLFVDAGEPRTPGVDLALNLATAAAVLLTLGSFVAMGLRYGPNLQALSGG